MTRLIGSLIVALVLAAPSLSEAECAWVLWQGRSVNLAEPQWQSLDGFPKWADCIQMKMAKHTNLADIKYSPYGNTTVVDMKDRVVMRSRSESGKEEIVTIEFRCLPDTVDPRGPKGK